MRVSQRSISRNYINNLNTSMQKRAASLERSASGLRFGHLSEDVASGARAMKTQEMRYAANQQLNTAEALEKEMDSAWSTLGIADDTVQKILEKVKSAGGVKGEVGLAALRKEIGKLKDELLQTINTQFGEKYLFGGTNNASPPFSVDATTGKLAFNGVAVDTIYKNPADGKFYHYADPANQTAPDPVNDQIVPQSGDIYLDVGFGMKVDSNAVDPRTAFKVNISGLEILGFNGFLDATGDPEIDSLPTNLYDLITEIENSLGPDLEEAKLAHMQTRLTDMNDKMRMARTEVDTQVNTLSNTVKRLKGDIASMEKVEDSLMTASPTDEAIKMKENEYSWMAILALGSRVLPSSLLDYLR